MEQHVLTFILTILVLFQVVRSDEVRWCVISDDEFSKCEHLKREITANSSHFTGYSFYCVLGSGMFDCMQKIKNGKADMMTVDSGLSIVASELYQLRPVAAENYGSVADPVLEYYSTIVMRSSKILNLDNLRSANVCSAGVGTSDGWIMPMSMLITTLRKIPVTQCNSRVQTATAFFNGMCIPGSLTSVFNPFGDNPNSACNLCYKDPTKRVPDYCSFKNKYAGSYGAMSCIHDKNADLSFTRNGEASRYAMDASIPPSTYKLLCPDGTSADITPAIKEVLRTDANGTVLETAWSTSKPKCNWGNIPSKLVLTSLTRSVEHLEKYRTFLSKVVELYGPNTTSTFKIFSSHQYSRRDLMFSDWTRALYDLKNQRGDERLNSIYLWLEGSSSGDLGVPFYTRYENLKFCPLRDVQWCVITDAEMQKCADMKLAFSAKGLKPDLNCVKGGSSLNCMRFIQKGFADLITLDAAELFVGGMYYGLVPIAAEYYGDGTHYYAVAIARKKDTSLIISNMKNRRVCHSAISTATGWVVPLNLVLETGQIKIYNGKIMRAYAELVSRACIPGILSNEYDPSKFNPISLCESCASGGNNRCQRNDRELYFGDSGAFRCLAEGADLAFARHTTVRENTGGRNPAYWARNRRAWDYELLCRDGTRRPTTDWANCNLGQIPGHTVVTAGYKTATQKEEMWRLLQYALEYFSSDSNVEFKMFDSGPNQNDLLFQDSAETLVPIHADQQDYQKWLGYDFMRKIDTLRYVSQGSTQSGIGKMVSASSMNIAGTLLIATSALLTLLIR